MLETFTVATFAEHLGETFRISPDASRSIEVELIEVTDLSERSGRATPEGRRPFSIVFRGHSNLLLPQGIYRMEHDMIGAFALFLVPIGPDAHGLRHEAIFT